MTELIFNGQCFPRLAVAPKIKAPCDECHGLGYKEDEELNVYECRPCKGTGSRLFPVPTGQIRVAKITKKVRVDARTQAAFDAYQSALKIGKPWRDAIVAVLTVDRAFK